MAEIRTALQKLKNDKTALFTVIIGLIGMLLVVLSELPLFSAEAESKKDIEGLYSCAELEKETEKLLSQIKGAGRVSVMLTFESDEEMIYAKDTEEKTKGDGDEQSKADHIIVDSSDGETGLVVKVIYPKVRGVAVVCTGGDDPLVRSEVSAVVSALFDIGSNRISIARMAEEE